MATLPTDAAAQSRSANSEKDEVLCTCNASFNNAPPVALLQCFCTAAFLLIVVLQRSSCHLHSCSANKPNSHNAITVLVHVRCIACAGSMDDATKHQRFEEYLRDSET